MSRAGGDPLAADRLPELPAEQIMVFEAPPDPPAGPVRDALADAGSARVDRAVALMDVAITGYNDRLVAVVEARMRGPKARKGTRFWNQSPDGVKSVFFRGESGSSAHKSVVDGSTTGVEFKALDASYVLPQRIVDELADVVRPVCLRIVADATSNVARSLKRPNTGLAAFDWADINATVADAVKRLLEVNERHARDIRGEILRADSSADSLDQAIDRVMEATRRGGRWLLLAGRTLATALTGDAALAAARALGVTHTQWLSRRDDHVRESHVVADGQVRPVGSKFHVGDFGLRFPADPEVLPEGGREVYGCRCSLIFHKPSPQRAKAVALAERGTPVAARRLLNATRDTGGGGLVLGAPELGAGMSIPAVRVPGDVVGYRVLSAQSPVTPGQQISWPGPLALALAPPVATGAAVLAVAIAAGTVVGVANGAAVLPSGTTLSVASVSSGQVVATPVVSPVAVA